MTVHRAAPDDRQFGVDPECAQLGHGPHQPSVLDAIEAADIDEIPRVRRPSGRRVEDPGVGAERDHLVRHDAIRGDVGGTTRWPR